MDTEASFDLVIIAVTAMGAFLSVTVRHGSLRKEKLLSAVSEVIAVTGMTAIFLILNLLLGVASVLALRATTGHSPSVYPIFDPIVPVFSMFEGVFFYKYTR